MFRILTLLIVCLPSLSIAATAPAIVNGCEFFACESSTQSCCQMARDQKTACLATNAANAAAYPNHGKWGKAARAAVGECAFCSQVYLNQFCNGK